MYKQWRRQIYDNNKSKIGENIKTSKKLGYVFGLAIFTLSTFVSARIDCGTVNGEQRCFECNESGTKCSEVLFKQQ